MLSKINIVSRSSELRIKDSIDAETGIRVPCIEGFVSKVNDSANNGYMYKNGFWEQVLDSEGYKERLRNREILGMIEHPTDDVEFLNTPYLKAAILVLDSKVVDGNPFAKFALCNNVHGNSIKALVDLKVPIGISTRAFGQEITDDYGKKHITADKFAFICWDITNKPNFGTFLEKVTDSMRGMEKYKTLLDMYHLRDGDSNDFNKESLVKDLERILQQLKNL